MSSFNQKGRIKKYFIDIHKVGSAVGNNEYYYVAAESVCLAEKLPEAGNN